MGFKWIEINPDASPVQGAIELGKAIEAERAGNGPSLKKLSQGAETYSPEGELGKLFTFSDTASPQYNTDKGGPVETRVAAAEWVTRFFGIPADKNNTFVLQTNGRFALGMIDHIVAAPFKSMGMQPYQDQPDTAWPMTGAHAEFAGMGVITHKVEEGNFVNTMTRNATPRQWYHARGGAVSSLYQNFPHNPTSSMIQTEENDQIIGFMEAVNKYARSQNLPPSALVIDNPYFMACEQGNFRGAHLNSGYNSVLSTESETPWAAAFSLSKAYGTASLGTTIVVLHPKLAGKFRDAVTLFGPGVGYSPAHMQNMAKAFSPEKDNLSLAHMGKIADKYAQACDYMQGPLGNAETKIGNIIVPGGVGMTRLIEYPESLEGKPYLCSDGVTRNIDGPRIIEILANDFNALTVHNGGRYIRLAYPGDPKDVRAGIDNVATGLTAMLEAPSADRM